MCFRFLLVTSDGMHYSHFYPNAEARFPALEQLPHLEPVKALLLSGFICPYLSSHTLNMTDSAHLQTLFGKHFTGSLSSSTVARKLSPGSAQHPSPSCSMTNAASLVACYRLLVPNTVNHLSWRVNLVRVSDFEKHGIYLMNFHLG